MKKNEMERNFTGKKCKNVAVKIFECQGKKGKLKGWNRKRKILVGRIGMKRKKGNRRKDAERK